MPTDYRYLEFHAAERPAGIALIVNGRPISYAEFSRNVRRLTRALREFQLPPGSSAAVGCAGLYLHWVLLLAFERLGIATASLREVEGPDANPLLAGVDLVLSEQSMPAVIAKRHVQITRQWIEAASTGLEDTEADRIPALGDAPLRILTTSGTTGAPKRLVNTRQMMETKVDNWIWCSKLTSRSLYLLTIPLAVGGAYIHASACLRCGATLVSEGRMSMAQALASHGITHVTLLPARLKQTLDELPPGYARPPGLTVFSFGAPVAAALREQALAHLADQVLEYYGSNEAGLFCTMRSANGGTVGAVWPGFHVEIVDERDQPVPQGELGRIRVRGPAVASGYLDDPEATRRMFRDGWFYPGDLGILRGRRQVQLVSREDALLNIGGSKVAPEDIEDLIASEASIGEAGVREVAVCALPNSDGIEEVWIAICHDSADERPLASRFKHAFRDSAIGNFHLVRLPRIPRTPTGKIERALLKRAVAEAASAALPDGG